MSSPQEPSSTDAGVPALDSFPTELGHQPESDATHNSAASLDSPSEDAINSDPLIEPVNSEPLIQPTPETEDQQAPAIVEPAHVCQEDGYDPEAVEEFVRIVNESLPRIGPERVTPNLDRIQAQELIESIKCKPSDDPGPSMVIPKPTPEQDIFSKPTEYEEEFILTENMVNSYMFSDESKSTDGSSDDSPSEHKTVTHANIDKNVNEKDAKQVETDSKRIEGDLTSKKTDDVDIDTNNKETTNLGTTPISVLATIADSSASSNVEQSATEEPMEIEESVNLNTSDEILKAIDDALAEDPIEAPKADLNLEQNCRRDDSTTEDKTATHTDIDKKGTEQEAKQIETDFVQGVLTSKQTDMVETDKNSKETTNVGITSISVLSNSSNVKHGIIEEVMETEESVNFNTNDDILKDTDVALAEDPIEATKNVSTIKRTITDSADRTTTEMEIDQPSVSSLMLNSIHGNKNFLETDNADVEISSANSNDKNLVEESLPSKGHALSAILGSEKVSDVKDKEITDKIEDPNIATSNISAGCIPCSNVEPTAGSSEMERQKMDSESSDEVPAPDDTLGLFAEARMLLRDEEEDEEVDDDDVEDDDDDNNEDDESNQMAPDSSEVESNAPANDIQDPAEIDQSDGDQTNQSDGDQTNQSDGDQTNQSEQDTDQAEEEVDRTLLDVSRVVMEFEEDTEDNQFEFTITAIAGTEDDPLTLDKIKEPVGDSPTERANKGTARVLTESTVETAVKAVITKDTSEPMDMEKSTATETAKVTDAIKVIEAVKTKEVPKLTEVAKSVEPIELVETSKPVEDRVTEAAQIDAGVATTQGEDTNENLKSKEVYSSMAVQDVDKPQEKPTEVTVTPTKQPQQLPEETADTPSKTKKKLNFAKPGNVMNIVDLGSSSDSDDVQEMGKMKPPEVPPAAAAAAAAGAAEPTTTVNIPRDIDIMCASGGDTSSIVSTPDESVISGIPAAAPPKKVAPRINTSEITIKTTPKTPEPPTITIPDEVTKKAEKTRTKVKHSLEVFNVDSDEEDAKVRKSPRKLSAIELQAARDTRHCVNYLCRSGAGGGAGAPCRPAPGFVLSHYEGLMEGVRGTKPLLSLDMEKECQEFVEISDSDSDSEGEEAPADPGEKLSPSTAKLLEEELAEVLNETWRKYGLDERIRTCEDELREQLQNLEKESTEIDDMLAESQKTMDRLRNELYATFASEVRELPPIEIDDGPPRAVSVMRPVAEESTEIDDMLAESQKTMDRLRNELYATFASEVRELPPIEIDDGPPRAVSVMRPVAEESTEIDDMLAESQKTMDRLRNELYATSASEVRELLPIEIDDGPPRAVSVMRPVAEESTEIDDMLAESQKTMDRLRNELYATFASEVRELPPIEIDDGPPRAMLQQLLHPTSTEPDASDTESRRSKRQRKVVNYEEPSVRSPIPLSYAHIGSPQPPPLQVARDSDSPVIVEVKLPPKSNDDSADVSVVELSAEAAPAGLPAPGLLERPPPQVGDAVFAMRQSVMSTWVPARVLEVAGAGVNTGGLGQFLLAKIRFDYKKGSASRQLSGRQLAYFDPAPVRLTIATRVIALFQTPTDSMKKDCYYSGIIAETPTPVNSYRYLVFFDDGYAQYVPHSTVRVVCEASPRVWDDVHPDSRDFVRKYLLAYPERPMVRLQSGQALKTEYNGKWWVSRVVSVDASLVQVLFETDGRVEWIYRGSTRLAPLYLELQASQRQRPRGLTRLNKQAPTKANMPYVEYTRSDEQESSRPDPVQLPVPIREESRRVAQAQVQIAQQRAVAKKSTVAPQIHTPQRPGAPQPVDNLMTRVVYYSPKAAVKPLKMVPHECSASCRRTDVLPLRELKTYNPLTRPLLTGWERHINRFKGKKVVTYRSPCGRIVRDMRDLHRYLRAVRSEMSVDLFDFNHITHCLAEFVLNKCYVSKKDLSHGKENVPVPCVNYYDGSLPEFCLYNTERTPTAGVPLNLDPEFLCGCDCTDDCQDKSKCACWKLTLEGAKTIGLDGTDVGYHYKRLPEPLPSGIYECNSRCKCAQTCLNRVAQHPLQLKLQVFKTFNRGWGIRALNDVPKGAFLCVYAGNLLTDATANLDGVNEGDEYLAELDYIEVVERMKEGYESDVQDELGRKKNGSDSSKTSDEESEEEDDTEKERRGEDIDADFRPDYVGPNLKFTKSLRKRKEDKQREKEKNAEGEGGGSLSTEDDQFITISDDEEVREPSRFTAQTGLDGDDYKPRHQSVRTFYGRDEACYIMDAKVQGNIGRYLNHSCSPNVFVQNVFVDTHDPRFPWVAFFALCHVQAGSELTWNYNYDVGSVPDKVMYCKCGAPNCRGRLL